MSTLLQRMTAWLCLAAGFLAGLTPAQGFVLCLQPTGRMSVDLATRAEHCQCCDAQEQGKTPEVQQPRSRDACCDCLDVPVSGALQDRLTPRGPVVPQLGPCIVPESGTVLLAHSSTELLVRALRAEVPRPPGSLALIRSVVLLL